MQYLAICEVNLTLKMDTPIVGPLWHIKVQYLAMCEANLTLKMDTILMFFYFSFVFVSKNIRVAKNKTSLQKIHFIEQHFNFMESFLLSTFHCFTVSDYQLW